MSGGFQSYGEMFEFDLHEMWNASESTRRPWFEWWLSTSTFECESCEAEFTPDPMMLEEDSEVVCSRCSGNR